MSVLEHNVVDGAAIDTENKCLRLMISDHLDWEEEYKHLKILQEKINAYLDFCEDGQYKKLYGEADIEYAVFEIHFLYEPTETAIRFLERVQEQLVEFGITIECHLEA